MAGRQLFNPPDPLPLSKGNSSQNWKRFTQKWTNYELATGIFREEDQVRVAAFITLIGDEAFDVYNAFTLDSEDDKIKIAKVLEQFDNFCEPRKNNL